MKNLKKFSSRLVGSAVFGLTLLTTPAISLAEKVRAENFSAITDIEDKLGAALSAELKTAIKKQGLAVFIYSLSFPKERACYVLAGVTTPSTDKRHPRLPAKRFGSFTTLGDEPWNEKACLNATTQALLDSMGKATVADALQDIGRTVSSGTPTNLPEDKTRVSLAPIGLSEKGESAVFDRMFEAGVNNYVDYRYVQTAVFTDSLKLQNGHIMCVSVAGLTARKPDVRNIRWPGNVVALARIQEGGTTNGCADFLAQQSVEQLFKQEWSAAALLKNFSSVREDGVPVPTAESVKQRLASAVKTQNSQTTSVTDLTCQNRCINGDCVRTFSNGRKERWQAPRVFNPLTSNWEWDTLTNACGS